MSDEVGRKAPEYGEYATPEEQAAASGTPWAPPAIETRVEQPVAAVPAPRSASQFDLLATLGLLAVGLFNVFNDIGSGLSLSTSITSLLKTYGISSTFHGADWIFLLGYAIVAISIAGWGIALFVSLRRLRSGRLAFWVPLAAGVGTGLIMGVLIFVAMSTDPSFSTYLDRFATLPTPTSTPTP